MRKRYRILYKPSSHELKHFGIKGMHWGDRNGPPYPLEDKQKSKSEKTSERKLSESQKKALKALAAVLGVSYYAIKKGKSKEMVESGKDFVEEKFSGILDNGLDQVFEKRSDIPDIRTDYLGINPSFSRPENLIGPNHVMIDSKYGLPLDQENCLYCSTVYDLKRRGYNIVAQAKSSLSENIPDFMSAVYKNPKLVNLPYQTENSLYKNLSSLGNNARGSLFFNWRANGKEGGHVISFEVFNGKPILFDTQSEMAIPIERIASAYPGIRMDKIGYVRTDLLEINNVDKIKEFALNLSKVIKEG